MPRLLFKNLCTSWASVVMNAVQTDKQKKGPGSRISRNKMLGSIYECNHVNNRYNKHTNKIQNQHNVTKQTLTSDTQGLSDFIGLNSAWAPGSERKGWNHTVSSQKKQGQEETLRAESHRSNLLQTRQDRQRTEQPSQDRWSGWITIIHRTLMALPNAILIWQSPSSSCSPTINTTTHSANHCSHRGQVQKKKHVQHRTKRRWLHDRSE